MNNGLIKAALAALAALAAVATFTGTARAATVSYQTVTVAGVSVAYREAGDREKPTILLLHGVPSSSRMYDALMRRLGDRYHLVAPDYPGFGNSEAPSPNAFTYTFDNLARVMQAFTDAINVHRYVLFMQDYGAPVGMRMAESRPEAVQALVFQNGNMYEAGLGPMWAQRRAFWTDRPGHESEVARVHQSLAATRARHIGSDPNVRSYDPDLWMDEFAYLNRPGQARIQTDLIYDYQTNIAAYPRWQTWMRQKQLPTLVIWGKHDLAFTVPGAEAFRRDNADAEIHVLDGGHFVMDTRLDEVVAITDTFVRQLQPSK